MKTLRWIRFLTLVTMIAGTFILPVSTAAVPGHTPKRQLMKVGTTKQFGLDMNITFQGVIADRRCPVDHECANPGDAKIQLAIKVGSQPFKSYSLHTDKNGTTIKIPVDDSKPTKRKKYYIITIASLSPQPYKGKITPSANYRLDLDVEIKRR